jgi:NADH:ubiquinone oxidoreductase subunit 3 (subunit A)
VRLTVLIGVTALMVCGLAVFYTHRTAHGTTAEERAAYESGEKAGEQAPRGATLPAEAELKHDGSKVFRAAGLE